MIKRSHLLSFTLLLALAACGYETVTGGGGTGGGNQGGFTLTAKTNSVAWKAATFSGTTSQNGQQIVIAGTQHTDSLDITIALHLATWRGAGTYDLAAPSGGSYAVVEYARLPQGAGATVDYSTSDLATGSVVVSSFNNHSGDLVATFLFSTEPATTPGAEFPDSVGVSQGHVSGPIAP